MTGPIPSGRRRVQTDAFNSERRISAGGNRKEEESGRCMCVSMSVCLCVFGGKIQIKFGGLGRGAAASSCRGES